MQENKGNNITSAFNFSEEVCFINFSFKSIFLFFPEINARLFLTRKKVPKKNHLGKLRLQDIKVRQTTVKGIWKVGAKVTRHFWQEEEGSPMRLF